ncbi:MAG: ELM1/GtrOC1 family putative glycosyltransferase [Burkholderiales bacterium]
MDSETNSAPIWVLLGKWHGDNQQLLAIAEALKLPFQAITLRFNHTSWLPAQIRASSHVGWRTDKPLGPPWPRIVLSAGGKSVPTARWIRRQSGGYTRLVNVNRPWAPLSWFDLVITTPQYALPERPNVLSNLMPFVPPAADTPPQAWLPSAAASMPRPWTAVLIGGSTRPYVYSDAAARALAAMVNKHVRETGGSAWLLDSPRTPSNTIPILEQLVDVPSNFVHWRGEGKKAYRALLASADRFIVTEDSASMTTEALLSDRPVALFDLPVRPGWGRRFASAWRVAAERAPSSKTARIFEAVIDFGMLTDVRDVRLLHRALAKAGMFDGSQSPTQRAAIERQVTLARIHALIEGP